MTYKQVLTKHLESHFEHRERKYKDAGMVDVMLASLKFPAIRKAVEGGLIKKQELLDFIRTYSSLDRDWRQILEERKDLRGSDYGEKVELEVKKQKELGYGWPEGGFNSPD